MSKTPKNVPTDKTTTPFGKPACVWNFRKKKEERNPHPVSRSGKRITECRECFLRFQIKGTLHRYYVCIVTNFAVVQTIFSWIGLICCIIYRDNSSLIHKYPDGAGREPTQSNLTGYEDYPACLVDTRQFIYDGWRLVVCSVWPFAHILLYGICTKNAKFLYIYKVFGNLFKTFITFPVWVYALHAIMCKCNLFLAIVLILAYVQYAQFLRIINMTYRMYSTRYRCEKNTCNCVCHTHKKRAKKVDQEEAVITNMQTGKIPTITMANEINEKKAAMHETALLTNGSNEIINKNEVPPFESESPMKGVVIATIIE